jgi:hypothetical protein
MPSRLPAHRRRQIPEPALQTLTFEADMNDEVNATRPAAGRAGYIEEARGRATIIRYGFALASSAAMEW